jgi:hypothetical protein
MDKLNIFLFSLLLIIFTIGIYYFNNKINETRIEIKKTNERISTVITNWTRVKGDKASCNEVCQSQNLECVFGQLFTYYKSDDAKIIDCTENYSNAEWLKPYTLNCICRHK